MLMMEAAPSRGRGVDDGGGPVPRTGHSAALSKGHPDIVVKTISKGRYKGFMIENHEL